jgi:RHS repeat-associated protein
MGNVTQRQDNNRSLTENLYYDSLYRLSTSSLNGTQNLSVSYDVTGNITSRSDVASGTTWTYDPVRKHAVTKAGSSSFAYAYDANGNMSSRQGATLTWSSYNYPTAISAGSGSTAESISLGYGPDRQRYEQIYGGNGISQTTFYIGGLLELVEDTGVNTYRHYIYAGNQPVAVYSRTTAASNTYNYLLGDHQGSVAAITNSSGALVVAESNTPFGTRRNPTTWSGAASTSDLTTSAAITRQGYTFQTALGLWTGLNHMNGRVQDSVTGRFLSADPGGTDQNNTQSWNRYTYVTNNPLTYNDPTGMEVDSPQPIDPNDLGNFGLSGGDGSLPTVTVTAPPSGNGDTLPPGAVSSSQSGGGSGGGSGSSNVATVVVSGTRTTPPPPPPLVLLPFSFPNYTFTITQPQGNQELPEVCVGSGCPGHEAPQSPQVAQFEGLPPGIEIIIEGTRVQRGSPTYTPEQPVPPVPRGPVQSPVNPSTTPPPGQPGWLWWQMFQLFFRGFFNGAPSVVPPTPAGPTDCTQQLCA